MFNEEYRLDSLNVEGRIRFLFERLNKTEYYLKIEIRELEEKLAEALADIEKLKKERCEHG